MSLARHIEAHGGGVFMEPVRPEADDPGTGDGPPFLPW